MEKLDSAKLALMEAVDAQCVRIQHDIEESMCSAFNRKDSEKIELTAHELLDMYEEYIDECAVYVANAIQDEEFFEIFTQQEIFNLARHTMIYELSEEKFKAIIDTVAKSIRDDKLTIYALPDQELVQVRFYRTRTNM